MLLQALVHEVSVTSRDHIEPFFRVPQTVDATAVRAVSGLVEVSGTADFYAANVALYQLSYTPAVDPRAVTRYSTGATWFP